MKLRCVENRVEWERGHLHFPIRPMEAIRLDDRILVIHDYMAYPQGRAAANLVAYSPGGEVLWIAENPGAGGADAYVNFVSESPLRVWNFACYVCTIDPESGKLVHAQFTK
jgi:hypothetical protein